MNELIAELITGIEANEDEAFLGASEVAAASCFGFAVYQALEPYHERLAADPPGPEDVAALKSALVARITSSPMPATAAAFALGKFHDPALAPLLREQLARHLGEFLRYNAAIANLIGALDNSGETIIRDGVHSITETDRMINDARAYLSRHGQVFPW